MTRPRVFPDRLHGVTSASNTFDGRSGVGAAIGVVPVCHDDLDAPAGCAALRELRGQTLLVRSVTTLLGSPLVERVLIAAPPVLVAVVERLLADPDIRGELRRGPDGAGAGIQVLPVRENGHGFGIRAVLDSADLPENRPVVVHDPLYPLASQTLVTAVVEALTRSRTPSSTSAGPGVGPDIGGSGGSGGGAVPSWERRVAAVPVRPVTDTLKWIDEDDVVLGTADREQFRMVYSPQAYWSGALRTLLASATSGQLCAAGPDVLPQMVQAAGGRLLPVPAPAEVFRLSTEEDLVLADAMLHVAEGVNGC